MKLHSAALLLALAAPATAQINTSALSVNGWYSDDTRADGSGTQTAGTNLVSDTLTDDPEATAVGTSAHDADILDQILFAPAPGAVPGGTWLGAVRLRIDGGAGGKSQISHRKDDGTGHGPGSVFGPGFSAEYSWMGDGTVSVTTSLKFGIKTADFGSTGVSSRTGENVWDKVLIYEPGNLNGGTADGLWHTETVTHTSGKWWFFDRTALAGTIGTPMTLSDMATSGVIVSGAKTVADVYALITAPGAHITSVQFGIGSGNAGGSVYVNQLTTNAYRPGQTTTFGPAPEFLSSTLAVGTAPNDVVADDLDDDGVPDIATADSGSDSVTVLLNDGFGGFGAPITVALPGGSTPSALAAGDLVTGGGRDLAVAATDGDAVIVLDNNPAGTFGVSSTLSTLPATEPVGVSTGDVNGNAIADIAVAMQGDLLLAGTGGVSVSIDGGALVALTAPVGGFLRPQSVLLCDLDSDGDDDVVATMMGTAFSPTLTDNILLWENVGGSFGAPLALSVSQNPRGLCCDDLDDDGDRDLAVTAESFPFLLPGTVNVFENLGLIPGAWSTAAFTPAGVFTGGTSPIDIACADLRDDSIPGFIANYDIVAVNFGSEDVTRFDGYDAPGDAFDAQSTLLAGTVPVAVAVADFDGDKTPDIVVANKASNDVTLHSSYTPSLAQTFGTGCLGTGGQAPQISAVGTPNFLNPAFGVKVSNARVFAPTLFGVSLNQFTTPLGGCELYLLPPLVLLATVTDGAGEATVTLKIPGAAAGVAGCDVFFQYFVFDPNGSYNGQFAFSDALRIKIGN